jgi:hypothetical protein
MRGYTYVCVYPHICLPLYSNICIYPSIYLSIHLEHPPPPLPAVYLVLSRGSNCCSDTESAIRKNPIGIGEREREREGEEVQSEIKRERGGTE